MVTQQVLRVLDGEVLNVSFIEKSGEVRYLSSIIGMLNSFRTILLWSLHSIRALIKQGVQSEFTLPIHFETELDIAILNRFD